MNKLSIVGTVICCAVGFFSLSAYAQSLEQTVQYAVEQHPDILLTLTERLKTQQQLKQSQADYSPEINLAASIGRQSTRSDDTDLDHKWLTQEDISLELLQNLFRGFETYYLNSANEQRITATEFQIADTSENIALLAVETYMNVLRLKQLVKVARDNVTAHSRTARQIKKRARLGLSRGSESQQAEGRLALAQANLDAEINNAQDAEASFLEIVGKLPENLTWPTTFAHPMMDDKQEALDTSLIYHPTLQVARANVGVTRFRHKATLSSHYPSLDFVMRSTYSRDNGGTEGESETNLIGLSLNYNLFRGGGRQGPPQRNGL